MADSRTLSLNLSLETLESVILRVGLIGTALFCFEAASRQWESGAMSSHPEAAALSIFNHLVAFALLKLFEASHLHDDIPKPAFKIRQTKRATLVLSTFAAMLSALVWLLVQKLD